VIPKYANISATVKPNLLSPILGSWYHSFGGITPSIAKSIATVLPWIVLNDGFIYHSLGGIIPFLAKKWATVSLLELVIDGLCYHYLGGNIEL